MKISEFIAKLEEQKKVIGDVDVFIDLVNIVENGAHEEYSYEDAIRLEADKIHILNMDTMNLSKKKRQVLAIRID